MILEIGLVDTTDADGFLAAYRRARHLVTGTPGFRSMRVVRGIESPERLVLLIEWDTLEAHTVAFRQSDRFPAWRAEIGPWFAEPPRVEHFSDVAPE